MPRDVQCTNYELALRYPNVVPCDGDGLSFYSPPHQNCHRILPECLSTRLFKDNITVALIISVFSNRILPTNLPY